MYFPQFYILITDELRSKLKHDNFHDICDAPSVEALGLWRKNSPSRLCLTTRYQERCRQTLHACATNIIEKCEFLVHNCYVWISQINSISGSMFFYPVKSCEVAALFCCLDLYSVGPLLRTSQVWPHSILGCLDLFRFPSQNQGGSQRPWSLSSFSRADMTGKQIPKGNLCYLLTGCFLSMQIWIGMDVILLCSFLSATVKKKCVWWNSETRILKDVNQTIREASTATCSWQFFLTLGSAAMGLLVMCVAVGMLLTHHKPD